MKYPVILIPSDQGFAVGCPALPGCWSQGHTRDEALQNIREAIRLWIAVAEEDARREADAEKGQLEEVRHQTRRTTPGMQRGPSPITGLLQPQFPEDCSYFPVLFY